jgi:hypothetical protein
MTANERKWEELTPDEKREVRFKHWLAPPGINFASPEAGKAYHARLKRLSDAYKMREPDRVPVSLPIANFPVHYAGSMLKTVMYDYEELRRVWRKYLNEFEMDTFTGPGLVFPGKVYDLLDCKMYRWPGHGIPENATGHQYVEGEYMMADEYDALIKNPSDFWMRTYMPRVLGVFDSFRNLQSFTDMWELPHLYFTSFARPDVQATFQALIDIGKESSKWQRVVSECVREALEAGVPTAPRGSLAKAPFDMLGDTLRGTRGIMMDMYRQPKKLLEAIEVITTLTIDSTIAAVNKADGITVTFVLHKGADGFLSAEQFDRFYWPSLRKVILALIDEGIIPVLFAEGSYMTRLERCNEFP